MTWQRAARFLAVAVCISAATLLAISQAFVVHDQVARVHPDWPALAQWAMAAGFELAIIAIGLSIAVQGHDWKLITAEALVLAPSVAIAANGYSDVATPAWLDTAAMSLMPLQYAVVILAGHRLAKGLRFPGINSNRKANASPTASPTPTQRKTNRKTRKSDALELIKAGEYDQVETQADLARALGVSESAVSRWPVERNGSGWKVTV